VSSDRSAQEERQAARSVAQLSLEDACRPKCLRSRPQNPPVSPLRKRGASRSGRNVRGGSLQRHHSFPWTRGLLPSLRAPGGPRRGGLQTSAFDSPVADCLIRCRRPSIRPAARSENWSESWNQKERPRPGRLSSRVTTRGGAAGGGASAEAHITTLGRPVAPAPDPAPAAAGGGVANQPSGPWGTVAAPATAASPIVPVRSDARLRSLGPEGNAPMEDGVSTAAGTAAAKALTPGAMAKQSSPVGQRSRRPGPVSRPRRTRSRRSARSPGSGAPTLLRS
jgi:hypothetical protein